MSLPAKARTVGVVIVLLLASGCPPTGGWSHKAWTAKDSWYSVPDDSLLPEFCDAPIDPDHFAPVQGACVGRRILIFVPIGVDRCTGPTSPGGFVGNPDQVRC